MSQAHTSICTPELTRGYFTIVSAYIGVSLPFSIYAVTLKKFRLKDLWFLTAFLPRCTIDSRVMVGMVAMSDDSRKRAKAHSSSGRQKKKDEKASQREDSFTSFSGPAPEGLSIEDAKLGARHTARGLAPIVPDDCTQSFAEGLKAIRARSLEELQELTAQFSVQHIERKTKEWQEKRGSTEKSDHHGA